MDKGSGDGADSAEDSGSSQPYPSTLPGIPKARFEIFYFLGYLFVSDMLSTELIIIVLAGGFVEAGQCQAVISTFKGANGG